MHDQPEPTEEEHEQGPGRRQEEDAMRQAGHDEPGRPEAPADEEA